MFSFVLFTISEVIRFKAVESRSLHQVCSAYFNEYNRTEPEPFPTRPNYSLCEYNGYNMEDSKSALQRANYYRKLVGFSKPNTLNKTFTDFQLQCAVVLHNFGSLTHEPSSSLKCYTKEAYTACSTSNLAYHSWWSGSTYEVDQYIDDSGVSSVGHRRWILTPSVRQFSFGSTGKFGAMKVIGLPAKDVEAPPFVAYPNPGYAPIWIGNAMWTFAAKGLSNSVTFSIKYEGNNIGFSTSSYNAGSNGNYVTYAFKPAVLNKTGRYDITVVDAGSNKTYEYFVQFHQCVKEDIWYYSQLRKDVYAGLGAGVPVLIAGIVIGVVLLIRAKQSTAGGNEVSKKSTVKGSLNEVI